LDIAAPGTALGQAIARWGNWVNQERYGQPTSAPWGIDIQPEFRLPGYERYARFHPLFLYESAWNAVISVALLILIWRYRDKLAPGLAAGIYFISYAAIRFLLEFLRLDRPSIAGIPVAQVISLAVILIWGALIPGRIRAHKRALQAETDASTTETAVG
jgi:prolipoprotein diacylglyceryl transferase